MTDKDMKLRDAVKAVLNGAPLKETARRYDVPVSAVSVGAKTLKLFGVTTRGDETEREKTPIRTPVITEGFSFFQLLLIGSVVLMSGMFMGWVVLWMLRR